MIDLGSLGAKGTESDVSVALGVNKLDQVVGYSYLQGLRECLSNKWLFYGGQM